jgi:hypothetical protein
MSQGDDLHLHGQPRTDRGSQERGGICADACVLDQARDSDSEVCALWDAAAMGWLEEMHEGKGKMHNRARRYQTWLRQWMLPAGGVVRTLFTDTSLTQFKEYGGMSDSAGNTGVYLGAESLRYMATGSPEALAQIKSTVQTLHHWWNVAGDPGVLARWAAPVNSDPAIVATRSVARQRASVLRPAARAAGSRATCQLRWA